jgi:hypothetical protein
MHIWHQLHKKLDFPANQLIPFKQAANQQINQSLLLISSIRIGQNNYIGSQSLNNNDASKMIRISS